MTLQLPAHLQNRDHQGVAQRAAEALGSPLPPHISIRGNTFTLVDAAGAEYNAGPTLDVVVVDSSGKPPPKRYYRDKWKPDSNEPPTCKASNGIVPDRDAAEPQARTCAECEWNKRGSKISELSGVAIKACRDEVWLAVLLPAFPTMMFQLVITPGSFENWGPYLQNFSRGVDVSDVITRLSFKPQVNGVLMFEILGYAQNQPQYISVDMLAVIQKARAEDKTALLVGRGEEQAALPPPAQSTVLQSPLAYAGAATAAPFASAAAAPGAMAPPAMPGSGSMFAQTAGTVSSTPEQPQRRKRRTQAEIQAAAAGQTQPSAGFGQPAVQQTAPFAPTQQPAPFAPQATAPGQPSGGPAAGNGAQFGMAAGAAPNADLQKALAGLFGKP